MLQVLLTVLAVLQLGECLNYRATINMQAYKGYVDFVPAAPNMQITVNLQGPAVQNYTVAQIYEFPVILGQARSTTACDNLGTSPTPLSGFIANGTFTENSLPEDNIFHRSIVLSGGSTDAKLCAVILPTSDSIVTYRAIFNGPIAGDVWVRKRQSMNGIYIFSNLAYSTNQANPTATTDLKMVGYSGGSIGTTFSTRCSSLSGPTDIIPSIRVGNSPAAQGRMWSSFISSVNDVKINWGLTTSSSADVIACTKINMQIPRSGVATIAWNNIRGTVSFTQNSPFDSTLMAINITGVDQRILPATYHVHKNPVPQRLLMNENRCSFDNVLGHFNPFQASPVGPLDSSFMRTTEGSDDQYEIGDLSGKHGNINTSSFEMSYVDWNLPLYGPHSVIGRSVVFHKSDSTRYACANIAYNVPVITAVARFKQPAYGTMYFQQPAGDATAPTIVFGAMANTNHASSVWHNFHVHQYPLGNDCVSAGPHYNPTGVSTDGNYTKLCSSTDPFRCELGDITGRNEALTIFSSVNAAGSKFFYTDPYLHLSGSFNIIGRSVVIHQFGLGAQRYACANITLVRPSKVETQTDTWSGDSADGTVTGKITITQDNEFTPAVVTANLAGLSSTAGGYHIHELPLYTASVGIGACSTSVISGHYSPFAFPSPVPSAAQGTTDLYEVGDFSNKFGTLNSLASLTLAPTSDHNLPLSTDVSVAGRSVLIHKASGTPWKCNSLLEQPNSHTGHVVMAEVVFASAFTGYIKLRQIIYEDGSSSPTTMEVSIFNSGTNLGVTTTNHNWHVHIDPVMNETQCSDALGHYNPYGAPVNSANYAGTNKCTRNQPLACELGDLSNKHAKLNIGGGRKLFVDVDLPLSTDKTVTGRSIVFHAENAGSARIGCANVLPVQSANTSATLAFPSTVVYDRYRFTKAVADALSISRHRVVILHNTKVPVSGSGCSKVMVHIPGSLPSYSLDDIISGTRSMSPYAPTTLCKSERGLTVVGLSALKGSAATLNLDLFSVLSLSVTSYLFQYVLF